MRPMGIKRGVKKGIQKLPKKAPKAAGKIAKAAAAAVARGDDPKGPAAQEAAKQVGKAAKYVARKSKEEKS